MRRHLGTKNGTLTVIEVLEPTIDKYGVTKYRAIYKCDCGNKEEKPLDTRTLKRTSCRKCSYIKMGEGRIVRDSIEERKLSAVHTNMLGRCNNPKHTKYHRYGGRGIQVHPEWYNKEAFIHWSLTSGYKIGLEIDRKDNDGDYSPTNCRWVNRVQNCRNKTQTPSNKSNNLPIGVTYCGNRYKAQRNGVYLGLYKTPDEAHTAWKEAL